jgi:hypothetical protein
MTSGRTGHWTKMHQSLAKFSESEASNHTPSLADFTTTTPELKFSVHTGGAQWVSVPGWKIGGPGRILRLMDDPAIKLYPDKDSGAWNWELLLRGKRIAYGESSDTQEGAYTAARQALAKERERRSKR